MPRHASAPQGFARLVATAALLLVLVLAAAAPAAAARALRQVDSSIRQETAHSRLISKLRKGATPDEAAAATAVFGKSNFEKRADLSQANNLVMNLKKYAKPTDTGARGAVAARIHSKLAKNYDGDTEDGVNFIQQSAQKSVRLTLARSDMEQKKSG